MPARERHAGGPRHGAAAIETLWRMVGIPSPTGHVGELAGYLVRRMSELGYRARIDRAGNVIGEIGTRAAPEVLLLGHLDTVPGGPAPRRDGDLIFGRGAVDAKGSLAAMVHVGALAAEAGDVRVTVAGAADEEGASYGARHLLRRDPPAAVVVGEPSGVGCVTVGYKGLLHLRYRVTRPPTHSSSPDEKAVEVAAAFWHLVRDRLGRAAGGRLFDRPIPALTALRGDLQEATAEISCRLPPGFDALDLVDWLRARAADGTVTVVEQVDAVRTPRTDPVVRLLSAAIRRHVGPPRTIVKLGTSDMNVVAPHWKVPIAAYGPGDSRLDHSADEHIDVGDYLRAIEVLGEAAPEIAVAVRTGRRETDQKAVR